MANLKEIKNELKKLGLNQNQVIIYLLLFEQGSLRIQEITNLTKIPRSSVYECLKFLSKMGLVERILEDTYTKIKAYPVSSMKHVLNEKLVELETSITRLDNLEKAIELLPQNSQDSATTVRYYKGVSGARQLLWNTLSSKKTVLVYSAWGRGSYVGIKFYKSFVAESKERKIKEKVLVNPTKRVLESIRKYQGSSIARTKLGDIRALLEEDIYLKGETFIYDNVYAQIYLKDTEEINGFEIESRDFTETQRSIFETLWKMAKPIEEFV